MIEVSSLIKKIRFKAKDFDEVKYTDYEILQQINECVEHLNNSFALQNADFLERRKTYEASDTGVFTLPSDFVTIVKLTDWINNPLHPVPVGTELKYYDYYILDGKIYTKTSAIDMVYRRRVDEVESVNDDIDLPEMFKTVIANGVAALLVGEDASTVLSALEDQIKDIVPRRRYVNGRIPMPF